MEDRKPMTETEEGHPHLRPIDAATVNALCDRAEPLVSASYTLLLEVKGFRESRTPWDARRLANALRHCVQAAPAELVGELDRLALELAGLKPS
jgi:hypothetical protein